MAPCEHQDYANDVQPGTPGACAQCLVEGTEWVSLRVCQTCGHVGCCNSSPGKHAKAHYAQTDHPLVEPLGGDDWRWCYADADYV